LITLTAIVWLPAEALTGDVTFNVAVAVAPAAIVSDDAEKLEVNPEGNVLASAKDVGPHVDESLLRTET